VIVLKFFLAPSRADLAILLMFFFSFN